MQTFLQLLVSGLQNGIAYTNIGNDLTGARGTRRNEPPTYR